LIFIDIASHIRGIISYRNITGTFQFMFTNRNGFDAEIITFIFELLEASETYVGFGMQYRTELKMA